MGYGILLAAVIVVVSGGIAYLGDVIGRRMGRKRLTLFGLRPRYTAIVISVFAGMLIAAWTLGGAMWVSTDVRDAFTRVGELRAANASLSRQAGELHEQISERTAELTKTQAESRRAEAEAKSLAAQAKTLAMKADDLSKRIAAQRTTLAKTETALRKSQRKLADVEQELANGLKVLQREEARHAYALQEWQARARAAISDIRSSRITFAANEEIGTVALDKGLTRPQVVRQLGVLLSAANALAVERGAKPDEQGNTVVLWGPDRAGKQIVRISPRAAVEAMADAIVGAPGGVVVRLVSLRNAILGEQVVADFQAFRSRLIYHQDDVLAEVVEDGGQAQSQLFAHLISLLRERVGSRARADGMMPVARRLVGAELVPQEGVGGITYEELFDRVDRIRELGGQVKVTARAAQDTWTAGPLHVKLEIGKA